MQIKNTKKLIFGIITILTSGLVQNSTVEAQISATPMQKKIIQLTPATVRTPEDMRRDDVRFINTLPQAILFRPGIDLETYRRLKDEANARRVSNK